MAWRGENQITNLKEHGQLSSYTLAEKKLQLGNILADIGKTLRIAAAPNINLLNNRQYLNLA